MKLQDLTGLSDSDPIHRYLGLVDQDHYWPDAGSVLSKDKIIEGIWLCLGHPVKYPEVEDYCFDKFEKYLQENGEPGIAELVYKLRRRKGQKGLDNKGIRVVIIWLAANIDYLKEKYLEDGNRPRPITAGWNPSSE